MEVLSIISNKKVILEYFNSFIKHYSYLKFESSDSDTNFYTKLNSKKNEIYFHFLFNSKEEIDLNFTIDEQLHISSCIKNSPFYIFDIQYRDELFLNKLLFDFKVKLNEIHHDENLIVLLSYANSTIKHFYS